MSAPVARTLSGIIALTVAAVPTGMKAGVRMSPRGVLMVPVRALPDVASSEKEKGFVADFVMADVLAEMCWFAKVKACQPGSSRLFHLREARAYVVIAERI